jgi:hypothetical protein
MTADSRPCLGDAYRGIAQARKPKCSNCLRHVNYAFGKCPGDGPGWTIFAPEPERAGKAAQ